MPRVASEASIPPQAGAPRQQFAGAPQRGGSDTFAPLLAELLGPVHGQESPEPGDPGKVLIATEAGVETPQVDATDQPDSGDAVGSDPSAAASAAPPASATTILAVAPPSPDTTPAPSAVTAPPVTHVATGTDPVAAEDLTPVKSAPLKPGTAETLVPAVPPGTTDSRSAAVGVEPAQITEGTPLPQLKPPRTPADSNKQRPVTAAGLAISEPAAKPADREIARPTFPGQVDARANEPTTKRESAAPAAPGKKAKPHAELRLPAANPAGPESRAPEIKIATTFAATAAMQSGPPSAGATPTAPPPAPAAPPTAPVPISGLAVHIAANAQSGRNRFDIRLDPPELGRIDVRLHFDASGQVTSHLIVERSETLDLLRRDAADLERSLQQAGLKTSDNGLQFSLRDQSQNFDAESDEPGPGAHVIVAEPDPAIDPDPVMRGYLRAGQGAGLDIRV